MLGNSRGLRVQAATGTCLAAFPSWGVGSALYGLSLGLLAGAGGGRAGGRAGALICRLERKAAQADSGGNGRKSRNMKRSSMQR